MNTTAIVTEPNGVPLQKLRGTVANLTDNPDLAAFRFTAKNTWVEGTATKSTIHEWYGPGNGHGHVPTQVAIRPKTN